MTWLWMSQFLLIHHSVLCSQVYSYKMNPFSPRLSPTAVPPEQWTQYNKIVVKSLHTYYGRNITHQRMPAKEYSDDHRVITQPLTTFKITKCFAWTKLEMILQNIFLTQSLAHTLDGILPSLTAASLYPTSNFTQLTHFPPSTKTRVQEYTPHRHTTYNQWPKLMHVDIPPKHDHIKIHLCDTATVIGLMIQIHSFISPSSDRAKSWSGLCLDQEPVPGTLGPTHIHTLIDS